MRFLIKHIFLWLLIGLFSLGYFIFFTEAGLQSTIQSLTQWIPGKLTIQTASGKLASRFTLKNIHYEDAEQQIVIQTLDIQWNPLGLFRDKLLVENFILDHAHIQLAHTNNKTDESSNKWLRFLIVKQFIVKQFIVKHLSVQYADMQVDFDGTLNQQWNVAWKANIPHLHIFSPEYSGSL